MRRCSRFVTALLMGTWLCATPVGAASVSTNGMAPCAVAPLDAATGTNVFILGDLTQRGTRVGGRLAVGGRATLDDASVGVSLSPASGPTGDALTVGDTLQFTGGAVTGNAVSEGPGSLAHVAFSPGGAYRRGPTLHTFAAADPALRAASDAYAALPPTGTTRVEYGQVILTGAMPALNVFAVRGDDLAAANSLVVDVPVGATVLVNVDGARAQMRNMGFALFGSGAGRTLFNLPQATALTLDGVGVEGSLLAPRAAITFRNGTITGTLIGASLTGSGGANDAPFVGCLPPVAGEPPRAS